MISGQTLTLLMFGGFGVAALASGITVFVRMRRFVATAARAAGKVVDYKREESMDTDDNGRNVRSVSYFPIVEFKDVRGTPQRAELSTGSSPPKFAIGTTVTVLFDKDNPNHAEIQSFFELWGFSILLLGMGTVFLAIAIVVWVSNMAVRAH